MRNAAAVVTVAMLLGAHQLGQSPGLPRGDDLSVVRAQSGGDTQVIYLPHLQRGWPEYPLSQERLAWDYRGDTNGAIDVAVDDATGLVWVATFGGLIRWDPALGRVKQYTSKPLKHVAVDASGGVWVAEQWYVWEYSGGSGISRLDPDGTWWRYMTTDLLAHGETTDIVTDRHGNVWIAFSAQSVEEDPGGLVLIKPTGEIITHTVDSGWPEQDVVGIASDRRGGVWITVVGRGIMAPFHIGHVNDDGATSWLSGSERPSRRTDVRAVDSDGSVYGLVRASFSEGAGSGVGRRRPDGTWESVEVPRPMFGSGTILHVNIDNRGNRWFLGEMFGMRNAADGSWTEYPEYEVYEHEGTRWSRVRSAESGRAVSDFRGMAFDPEGGTWFASLASGGGLHRLDAQDRWRAFSDSHGWWLQSVHQLVLDDRDGAWFLDDPWISSVPTGSLHRSPDSRQVSTVYGSGTGMDERTPAPLAVDHAGWIWLGSPGAERLWRVSPDRSQRLSITATEGLVSTGTAAIEVSPSGDVWVGSHGASRFDGNSWHTFTVSDGLATNRVRAMAFAEDGTTWAGASYEQVWDKSTQSRVTLVGGVSAITASGDVVTYRSDELASRRLDAVAVAPTGDVWVGTASGVYVLTTDREWIEVELPGTWAGAGVNGIVFDRTGEVWLTTTGDWGSVLKRESSGHWVRPAGGVLEPPGYAGEIRMDAGGDMWVSTNDIKGRRLHEVKSDDTHQVHVLPPAMSNVGTEKGVVGGLAFEGNSVLCRLGESLTMVAKNEQGNDVVTQILGDEFPWFASTDMDVDEDGGIWAATWQGLGHWTEEEGWRTLQTAEGLVQTPVSMVEVDSRGDVWIGYRPNWDEASEQWLGVGVTRIDSEGAMEHFGPSDGLDAVAVSDADVDTTGALWLVTHTYAGQQIMPARSGTGVSHRTADGLWIHHAQIGGVDATDVKSVEIGGDGTVWFGTSRNGLVWRTPHGGWMSDASRSWINEVRKDRSGTVWAGSSKGALRLSSDGDHVAWTEADGLSDDHVLDIAVDSRGRPWFATEVGGVSIMRDVP